MMPKVMVITMNKVLIAICNGYFLRKVFPLLLLKSGSALQMHYLHMLSS